MDEQYVMYEVLKVVSGGQSGADLAGCQSGSLLFHSSFQS